ncbi:hypothetical protein RR45_GL000103 [Lactococcus chungangensis CAU 28 = DSM 22330]|uniref:Uncharacterized protein n=1 Tax=Pseudolactococcus chungangensis CAU 28 = DSM 22330 TaxID=1122154 RepID=A0ABX4IAA8_9LACT|nr:hypothetical protein RR45_GL000103 [Lactococcus chungangensis CAU 28 = DSM 22330]
MILAQWRIKVAPRISSFSDDIWGAIFVKFSVAKLLSQWSSVYRF